MRHEKESVPLAVHEPQRVEVARSALVGSGFEPEPEERKTRHRWA